jgi:hypothetical protein
VRTDSAPWSRRLIGLKSTSIRGSSASAASASIAVARRMVRAWRSGQSPNSAGVPSRRLRQADTGRSGITASSAGSTVKVVANAIAMLVPAITPSSLTPA